MPVPQLPANWPVDDEGNHKDLVWYEVNEKIGLPNYSNVTVGPAGIMRFVKKGDKGEHKRLCDDVETIAREQREIVLNIANRQVK